MCACNKKVCGIKITAVVHSGLMAFSHDYLDLPLIKTFDEKEIEVSQGDVE